MKRIENFFMENVDIPGNARIFVEPLGANQYCIRIPLEGIYIFQSYESTCAKFYRADGVLVVFPSATISKTTSKYFRKFLEECGLTDDQILEIKKMVKKESFGKDCPLMIDTHGNW